MECKKLHADTDVWRKFGDRKIIAYLGDTLSFNPFVDLVVCMGDARIVKYLKIFVSFAMNKQITKSKCILLLTSSVIWWKFHTSIC